jgi:hypothetical protein
MDGSKEANVPEVKVGQVWLDCDRRTRGRRLKIVAIACGAAVVENLQTGRKTRVKLRRFQERSNGYRIEPPARDTDLLDQQLEPALEHGKDW